MTRNDFIQRFTIANFIEVGAGRIRQEARVAAASLEVPFDDEQAGVPAEVTNAACVLVNALDEQATQKSGMDGVKVVIPQDLYINLFALLKALAGEVPQPS